MGTISGGALFGKALVNEGVEKAFVLCGGHIMPIFYGMRAAGIQIFDFRHECDAMYAAIAYAQVTGKPTVVVTTAGPGVCNTTPGMVEAMEMGVPILHIGGAVVSIARDAGPLQDMSTLSLMEACSKWARKITNIARIPEYVSLAFRQAFDLTPGPVYLETPTDFVHYTVNDSEVYWPTKTRTKAIPFGDPALVEQAADLLVNAQRPVAIIADGVRFNIGDYAGYITALLDHLKIPLIPAATSCRGMFGDEYSNPLLKSNAISQADVVLAMGCRFDHRLGMGRILPDQAKIIQVHTDMRQIGFNAKVDIGIVGGAGPIASQILSFVKEKIERPVEVSWLGSDLKAGLDSLPDEYRSDKIPMHPARCAGEVAKYLANEGRDWNIAIDGGEAGVWMYNAVTAARPQQVYYNSAIGMIGKGPAQAIAGWIVNQKPVLWYSGDGSFGFYSMEMDTMARLGMPVVCVISNDSAWGMIRNEQKYTWKDEVEKNGQCNTELSEMRAYEKLVSMWGGYGEMVRKPEEIIPAIKRAVKNGRPSIINVEVDHESLSPFIVNIKENLIQPYYLEKR